MAAGCRRASRIAIVQERAHWCKAFDDFQTGRCWAGKPGVRPTPPRVRFAREVIEFRGSPHHLCPHTKFLTLPVSALQRPIFVLRNSYERCSTTLSPDGGPYRSFSTALSPDGGPYRSCSTALSPDGAHIGVAAPRFRLTESVVNVAAPHFPVTEPVSALQHRTFVLPALSRRNARLCCTVSDVEALPG
jgi:hypothetical protein